jgi:hypothetical protein
MFDDDFGIGVDEEAFLASHGRTPRPNDYGDWCFTDQPNSDVIKFTFNGTYAVAYNEAIEWFSERESVPHLMP